MVKPYIPPAAYKCQKCDRKEDLLLCVRCGEAAYCSPRCQKKDWKSHKKFCRQTDRVDLASFFPVLACIADISHAIHGCDQHIALRHTIINAPNPSTPPETLPDGRRARVVRLGAPVDKVRFAQDVTYWWPKGETMSVRAKLLDRVLREGNVLPIVVGTCIAIMLSIYCSPHATTPNPTRLRYKSSGIADFGVARGKVRVNPEEQLVYIHPDGKTIQYGQDPNNHYWIYFETQKGETIYLDCNLYTLNYCVGYTPTIYLTPAEARSHMRLLPALFWDRMMRKWQRAKLIQVPNLTEHKRTSFLRDKDLHRAMGLCHVEGADTYRFTGNCMALFAGMMGKVEGKTPSEKNVRTMIDTMRQGVKHIVHALTDGKWKSFPSDPQMRADLDTDT